MKELGAIDEWVFTTLSNDSSLKAMFDGHVRIFDEVAPISASFPIIVFNMQTAPAVNTVNGVRIMVGARYQVKAISKGSSFVSLQSIMNRVDECLHLSNGSNTTGDIYECVNTESVKYIETTNGDQYRHFGSIYRINARAN